MELDWSEQSPHIRSLYRPWQPGDGYDEAEIEAAETRLGLRLPATLRHFYLAWGKRRDITQMYNALLAPDELLVRAGALTVCAENQASWLWAIQREILEQANPPVVVGNPNGWIEMIKSGHIWMQSHTHLSAFLDDFTYRHAFSGGAMHGGHTDLFPPSPKADYIAWLEQHWHKATVTPMGFGLCSNRDAAWQGLPLYVRDGQAIHWWGLACSVVSQKAEALDEIAQRFQLTWAKRW